VIATLGILVAIAVQGFARFINITEGIVCVINRKKVERLFSTFNQFVIENFYEVCPAGGLISYKGGKVKCSVHDDGSESDEEEPPGEEVPWL